MSAVQCLIHRQEDKHHILPTKPEETKGTAAAVPKAPETKEVLKTPEIKKDAPKEQKAEAPKAETKAADKAKEEKKEPAKPTPADKEKTNVKASVEKAAGPAGVSIVPVATTDAPTAAPSNTFSA